jgi:hypothetical protein
MANITVDADCGNSPKKFFLKDVNIAFVEGNTSFISDSIREDIIWNLVGDRIIEGKADFIPALLEMKKDSAEELIISNVITHGKQAAVNGILLLQNGKHLAFCDVYEFSGAKGTSIKSIVSYVIELQSHS